MWRSWHSRYNWKLPEEKLKNPVNVRFFVRVLTSWSQVGTFISCSCSCSSMQSSKDSSLEKILNQSLGPQVIHTLIVGSKFIPLTKCLRSGECIHCLRYHSLLKFRWSILPLPQSVCFDFRMLRYFSQK